MAIQQAALRTADDAPGALSPEGIPQLGLGPWGSKSLFSESALSLDREKPSYIAGLLETANARLDGFWG
jgi:hypothetical protein